MKKLIFLSILAILLTLACTPAEEPAEPAPAPEPIVETVPVGTAGPEESTAVAVLHNADGVEIGSARFVQTESGVLLSAEVGNVARPGAHGFHVHEVGECIPPFKSAGGHFNPNGMLHGCPDNPERHAGDFGNIEIVQGSGSLEILSKLVTITPDETSIVGLAVILHEKTDNCVSQPTGAAGARLACGVIRLQVPADSDDPERAGADDDGSGKRHVLPRGDG